MNRLWDGRQTAFVGKVLAQCAFRGQFWNIVDREGRQVQAMCGGCYISRRDYKCLYDNSHTPETTGGSVCLVRKEAVLDTLYVS